MAVVVPIAADYDNSGVKSAQQAFASFSGSVSKALQQAAKDARKSFGDIEGGAQDSSTAAQRLAASISNAADKIDRDLKATQVAADALGRALGPGLAQKLGKSGLDRLITDLRRTGLTLEQITTDADVLALALNKLDNVRVDNAVKDVDRLSTAVNKTATAADRSTGVFANFAGNAAQEIPVVAAAMGPLNVAIGQFTEYAAEGNISLAGLKAVVGPIAIVTTAMTVLKGVIGANAEQAKLFKDNVDVVVKALLSAEDPITAIAQKNQELLSIKVYDPNKGVFGGTREISDDVYKLGLRQEDLTRILRGGKQAIEEWASTVEGSRKPLKRWALDRDEATSGQLVYKYLNDQLKAIAEDGFEQATQKAGVWTTAQQSAASVANAAALQVDYYKASVESKALADEAAKAKIDALKQSEQQYAQTIDSVREAIYRRNNASYAAEDAELNAKDAIDAANKAEERANRTRNPKDIADAAKATRDAERAINNAAGATDAYTLATSSSTDATVVARERTAAVVRQLKELELTIKEGSPLWDSIQAYKFLIETIPAEVNTKFGISFGSTRVPAPARLELPQLSAGALTSNAAGVVNNITINGAIDKVGTATELEKVTTRQNQRYGTGN